jgi:protein-S-isoprenylcysteine O-methyltransferase Ste14
MRPITSETLSSFISTLAFLFLLLPIFYIYIPYEIISSRFVISFTIGKFRYIGIFFIISGIFIAISCLIDFVIKGRGSPIPFTETENLIVSGFYRFVRNPLYIAGVFVFLGEALLFQSIGIFIYCLIMFAVFNIQVIMEEAFLKERFGEIYKQYYEAVPRWIPRLKPYKIIVQNFDGGSCISTNRNLE